MQTPPAPDSNQQDLPTTAQVYLTLLLRPHPNMRVINLSHPTNNLLCMRIGWSSRDSTPSHPLKQA